MTEMSSSNALGIEYRVVDDAEFQGQAVRVVSGARTYDTETKDLWDALTNPERLPRWFGSITGELKLGGRYQIENNAGGEITRCEPTTALDLTWEYGDNVSWVTVRLEFVGDGTRLTLQHLMGKDAASEEHWRTYGPGATGVGWELAFLGLGLYLESGDDFDAGENETWLATADGRSFLESCAKAWGDAHVRAGEDPATAQDMAAKTAAFYGGVEHEH